MHKREIGHSKRTAGKRKNVRREGKNFRQVCRENRRREQRLRVLKRVFVTAATIAMVCLTAFLLQRIPALEVFAASREVQAEKEVQPQTPMQSYSLEGMFDELWASGMLTEVSDIPVIFIDPGHGGEDEGCARGGIQEKMVNLFILIIQLETKQN